MQALVLLLLHSAMSEWILLVLPHAGVCGGQAGVSVHLLHEHRGDDCFQEVWEGPHRQHLLRAEQVRGSRSDSELAEEVKSKLKLCCALDNAYLPCVSLKCAMACVQLKLLLRLRECYAVATASGVSVWRIHHEQNYSKLRGGHSRAVIALHACTGETVGLALFGSALLGMHGVLGSAFYP